VESATAQQIVLLQAELLEQTARLEERDRQLEEVAKSGGPGGWLSLEHQALYAAELAEQVAHDDRVARRLAALCLSPRSKANALAGLARDAPPQPARVTSVLTSANLRAMAEESPTLLATVAAGSAAPRQKQPDESSVRISPPHSSVGAGDRGEGDKGRKPGAENPFSTAAPIGEDGGRAKRPKEDDLKLDSLPSPAVFTGWRARSRLKVASAANRADDSAYQWIIAVEAPDSTFEQFADRGGLPLLDIKLSTAVDAITREGQIGAEIRICSEQMFKQGVWMTGRQKYWMLLNHYRQDLARGFIYSFADISALRCAGDDDLKGFWTRWESVKTCLSTQIPEEILKQMFYD
jgi:hypothetical protein